MGVYMKVSAVNRFSTLNFNGEGSRKTNKVRNAAGAAMIALATTVPADEANAQLYRPLPPPPTYFHYYVPAPVMNIPGCFIVGDNTVENYEKTMQDVFNEVDRAIDENGELSVNEIVSVEANNRMTVGLAPMTRQEKVRKANLVKDLAKKYNQTGSNPNTIDFSEYQKIMNDYMQSKNIADFMNLLQIWTNSQYHYRYHRPLPPPRHFYY